MSDPLEDSLQSALMYFDDCLNYDVFDGIKHHTVYMSAIGMPQNWIHKLQNFGKPTYQVAEYKTLETRFVDSKAFSITPTIAGRVSGDSVYGSPYFNQPHIVGVASVALKILASRHSDIISQSHRREGIKNIWQFRTISKCKEFKDIICNMSIGVRRFDLIPLDYELHYTGLVMSGDYSIKQDVYDVDELAIEYNLPKSGKYFMHDLAAMKSSIGLSKFSIDQAVDLALQWPMLVRQGFSQIDPSNYHRGDIRRITHMMLLRSGLVVYRDEEDGVTYVSI